MRRFLLSLSVALLLLNASCPKKRLVVMTYRPVAVFTGYNTLSNSGGEPAFSGPNDHWVYYRIEKIDNNDTDAESYNIDYSRFFVADDSGEARPSVPNANLFQGFMNPAPFHMAIPTVAPHSTVTFPVGQDPAPRLVVWQSRTTGPARLKYQTLKNGIPVLLVLDTKAPPPFSPDPNPMTDTLMASVK